VLQQPLLTKQLPGKEKTVRRTCVRTLFLPMRPNSPEKETGKVSFFLMWDSGKTGKVLRELKSGLLYLEELKAKNKSSPTLIRKEAPSPGTKTR